MRFDLQVDFLLLFIRKRLFRNRSISFGLLKGTGDHFLHIWLLQEALRATHADYLVMAALICDQLVEGLQAEVGLLIVLSVL